MAVHSLGTQHI